MNLKSLLIFFVIGSFVYSGCSSSKSLRYGEKDQDMEKRDPSVRFTSKDDTSEQDQTYTFTDSADIYSDEDPDDIPEDESSIDLSSVMSKYSDRPKDEVSADRCSREEKLLMEIIEYLNTPYKYGGSSKKGIDCSAFTQTVFGNLYSIELLRSARDQFTQGLPVERDDLQFGDLVFFNTRRRVKPGHVGIYIGDNLFAHASSKHGVIVSSLDHEYYSKRFMGGRRLENIF